jgi:hypothetical protein
MRIETVAVGCSFLHEADIGVRLADVRNLRDIVTPEMLDLRGIATPELLFIYLSKSKQKTIAD